MYHVIMVIYPPEALCSRLCLFLLLYMADVRLDGIGAIDFFWLYRANASLTASVRISETLPWKPASLLLQQGPDGKYQQVFILHNHF